MKMNRGLVWFCFVSFSLVAICPGRVTAQYNEKDIYAYIDQYKDVAMQKMAEYKIPASITIAQGIFESACGKSRLATDGNNHFGIKCHTDWTGDTILIDDDELQECFRRYPTVSDSYTDHSLFLTHRSRYANLFQLNILDYPGWARTLRQDGYATNPQYADRLISLIERFNIARFDTLCLRQQGIDVPMATYEPRQLEQKPIANKNTHPKPEDKASNIYDTPVAPKQKPSSGQLKVFTAIGNDYPAGNSPFSYRKVFENNHTYFIIAQSGDTYERIATDVQVTPENLRKFNDVFDSSQPVENEIVYIEAKAKTNTTRTHEVQAGETLRYIAQRYGVQLHYILKYNAIDINTIIHPGDQILLRH